MDTNNTQVLDPAITEGQADPSANQSSAQDNPKVVAEPVTNPKISGGETDPVASALAYTPNYKFKASGKEHEIPEFLRAAIKNEEAEKHLRKVFEKAYGMDDIKTRLDSTKERFQQVESSYTAVMSQITEAQQAYRKGDLDTFFDVVKVSPEKVLQWAVEKARLSQMPPEQQRAYEDKRSAEKRAYDLEKQTRSMNEQGMQGQLQLMNQMLDMVLERPEVNAAAQVFDTRKGKEGSFRALVAQVGAWESQQTGKDLSPLEAVQKAIELIGGNAPAQQPGVAPLTAPATPATEPTNSKKTMPNLANAGAKTNTSPAKAKYKSIDDLKKRHQELAGA